LGIEASLDHHFAKGELSSGEKAHADPRSVEGPRANKRTALRARGLPDLRLSRSEALPEVVPEAPPITKGPIPACSFGDLADVLASGAVEPPTLLAATTPSFVATFAAYDYDAAICDYEGIVFETFSADLLGDWGHSNEWRSVGRELWAETTRNLQAKRQKLSEIAVQTAGNRKAPARVAAESSVHKTPPASRRPSAEALTTRRGVSAGG